MTQTAAELDRSEGHIGFETNAEGEITHEWYIWKIDVFRAPIHNAFMVAPAKMRHGRWECYKQRFEAQRDYFAETFGI